METRARTNNELVLDFLVGAGPGDFAEYEVAGFLSGRCDQQLHLAVRDRFGLTDFKPKNSPRESRRLDAPCIEDFFPET